MTKLGKIIPLSNDDVLEHRAKNKAKGVFLYIQATRKRLMYTARTQGYDVWMPNLGPSLKILSKFQDSKNTDYTWAHFAQDYRSEMLGKSELYSELKANRIKVDGEIKEHFNKGQTHTIQMLAALAFKGINISLICSCSKNEEQCHRNELTKLVIAEIERQKNKK